MADGVHDHWLTEAFTQFRADVREQSRPLGVQAVRHAVRRRRGVGVAAAAVTVALVGAVIGVAATVHRPHPYPPLSTAQLNVLQAQAYQALSKAGLGNGQPVVLTAQTQAETQTLDHSGSSPQRFARGDQYDLLAQCEGRGTVVMAWSSSGGPTGRSTVVCGGAALRVHFVPRVDVPAIQIRLTPDANAIGRAVIVIGFAEYQ